MIERDSAALRRGQWVFAGWCGRLTGLIAAVACLLTIVSAIDVTRLAVWAGRDVRGVLGLQVHASARHHGWWTIDSVAPDGAAQSAGLTPAMLVRFDRSYEARAELLTGRRVGLSAANDAGAHITGARHVWLTAVPEMAARKDRYRDWGNFSVLFAAWLCVALGTVAIVRGWGSIAALGFGLGMFSFTFVPTVPLWATSSWQVVPYVLTCAVLGCASLGMLLLPAVLYYERIAKPRWLSLALFAAITVTLFVARVIAGLQILDEPRFAAIAGIADILTPGVVTLCLALALYWSWRGWRDGLGADRGRFAALFATYLVAAAVILANAALELVPGQSPATGAMLFFIQQLLSNVLVPLALAYTVLRHRVVDLGFVINRTIVFGSVSALLLGCFGLIEWGVEHWLPESWLKASVWIDAGAALLVYLAFHRVHEAIESRIENLFFRGWHSNEAMLRRFVASAPHYEDERALARSFADELSRFASEARVALYRRRDRTHDAILERNAGSWDTAPRTLPVDDPAFALMRAERRAIDLSDTLTDLPGVLALPMLDHGMLTGLVLMDLKGNGALYRPDEIDVLGWAAHNVALAMAALHAGQIEAENRLLKAQLTRLGSLIGDRLNHAEI